MVTLKNEVVKWYLSSNETPVWQAHLKEHQKANLNKGETFFYQCVIPNITKLGAKTTELYNH